MDKGQIFSTDLLFGMAIILFGFGLMLMLSETSMYDSKHAMNEKQLQEKTQLALLLLTSSSIGQCDLNGTSIPYSINKSKFATITPTTQIALKKLLLLEDKNVQIELSDGTAPIMDPIGTANIITMDINILVCNNSTKFSDLNNCLSATTSCNNLVTQKIQLQQLRIKVGQ